MLKTNPILHLPNNINIISALSDNEDNVVLIGTDDGKIIKIDKVAINAYLTGKRSIYAQVKDGYGNTSETGWGNLVYELRNKILQVSDSKVILNFKTVNLPFSANVFKDYKAVFTSPVLYGGDDFIYWKTLQWQQEVQGDTKIDVYVRVGKTSDELFNNQWVFVGSHDENDVVINLDNFNPLGGYMQVKTILSTDNISNTPSLHSLRIFYKKSCGVYFYTKKYVLKKGSNPKSLMIVANISEPQYTEIKFGICGTESGDWRDYQIVDINKMISVPEGIGDRLKVGIKLSSFASETPIVDEFALILTSEQKNLLNQQ